MKCGVGYARVFSAFGLILLSALCFHSRGAAGDAALSLGPGTDNIVTVAGKNAEIGDGGPATSAQLNLPGSVAFDFSGNRYISEGAGHRVRKVDAAGIITTFAGTGGSGFNGDNIPAAQAQLSAPRGAIVD